jgi:hypothetical protein
VQEMTAEIAILNKTAVALAADSAVTISAGTTEMKIFDSADKLFELSNSNPIGVMIYNGMTFMETPLPSLIRSYRDQCKKFDSVKDAATDFLQYLCEFGKSSPLVVKQRSLKSKICYLVQQIRIRFDDSFQKQIINGNVVHNNPDLKQLTTNLLNDAITDVEGIVKKSQLAKFIGAEPSFGQEFELLCDESVKEILALATAEQIEKIGIIAQKFLVSSNLSQTCTGIVVAGFGAKELFPTLISFETDGLISDQLKYNETNFVDIDREGERAKVIPFAQKEMVDRFLYGLDDEIQGQVAKFCAETIPELRKLAVGKVSGEDGSILEAELQAAEEQFLKNLTEKAFNKIRVESKAEIEDMVEFMPKPELATMAEALVNLTSIKRRVSRGMETVGGPIDVAVISQSEGFVWVKRKHYFPAELNNRYLDRSKKTI